MNDLWEGWQLGLLCVGLVASGCSVEVTLHLLGLRRLHVNAGGSDE